jgi:multidrug efflux system outer membrane protein
VAANANVGAARALYYPALFITGALGTASTAFDSLFTGPASAGLIAARYAQLINVYPAMGGGWVDIAGSSAAGPQGTVSVRSP